MQVVCVGEVTAEYNIRVDDSVRSRLHPGEKIRLKIESIKNKKGRARQNAIERLKEISKKSRLGMYTEVVGREDAH